MSSVQTVLEQQVGLVRLQLKEDAKIVGHERAFNIRNGFPRAVDGVEMAAERMQDNLIREQVLTALQWKLARVEEIDKKALRDALALLKDAIDD